MRRAALGGGVQQRFKWSTGVNPAESHAIHPRHGTGPLSLLFTVGLSGGIGIFFGVIPARRAAQLDPIVALRRL